MQFYYKALGTLTLATSLFFSTSLIAADSLTNNNVVRAKDGEIIRSIESGTCVRTKWEHGSDECALPAKMAEKQEQRQQFRGTLEAQERSVYFGFNQSTLTPEAMRALDGLSEKLRNASDISSTEIIGFADRIGYHRDNQALSMQRAQAVKNYLASRGYLKTRVAGVHGVGESQPATNCSDNMSRNQTINCLSPDRRVEVKVHYTDIQPVAQY